MCNATVGDAFLRYVLLADGIITWITTLLFSVDVSRFILPLKSKTMVQNVTDMESFLSRIFQGRSGMIGSVAIFAYVYNDPVVRLFAAILIVCWCIYFGANLILWYRDADEEMPKSANITLIGLCTFVMLYGIGIGLQVGCTD